MKKLLTPALAFCLFISITICAFAKEKAYTVVSKKVNKKSKTYIITLSYPQIQGLADKKVEKIFNNLVLSYITKLQDDFKKEVAMNITSTIAKKSDWPLILNYKLHYNDNNIISISFQGSEFVGGAHPVPICRTVLFNLKSGKELKLKDLFLPNSDYLKKISDYCINSLMQMNEADADFIKTGASADEKNYTFFYITDSSLFIIFSPAQVAPSYKGFQETQIPFQKLKEMNIIDRAGAIGNLVK